MSGGGGSTTTQKADPWSGVQPYLQQLYSGAGNLAGQGGPQVAQNNGVAGFTPYTQDTQNLVTNLQANGDPNQNLQADVARQYANGSALTDQSYQNLLMGSNGSQGVMKNAMSGNDATGNYYGSVLGGNDASSQYLKNVMGGGYLNGNPNLTAAMDAANSNTTRQFNTAVMPQLASQFSLAGRYGSGAQSQGVSDATNNLATQLSNTNAGIMNQNYQNERGMQNNAAGALAGMGSSAAGNLGNYTQGAAGAYLNSILAGTQGLSGNQMAGMNQAQQAYQNNLTNLNARGTVSDQLQQQAQAVLSGNNALFNANQQRPYANESWLNGILNGSMALNGQTSVQSPNSSSFQRLGGGALSGAATGAAIGSIVPGIGTGIGAGVGALGGALMSIL